MTTQTVSQPTATPETSDLAPQDFVPKPLLIRIDDPTDEEMAREVLDSLAGLIESIPLPPKAHVARQIGLAAFRWIVNITMPAGEMPTMSEKITAIVEKVIREALQEQEDFNYRIKLDSFNQWYKHNYRLMRDTRSLNRETLFESLHTEMPALSEASIYFQEKDDGDDEDARRKRCIFLYMYAQTMRLICYKELFMLSMPSLFDAPGRPTDIDTHMESYRRAMFDVVSSTYDHWSYMKETYGIYTWFLDQKEMVQMGEAFERAYASQAESVVPLPMVELGLQNEHVGQEKYKPLRSLSWRNPYDAVTDLSMGFFHVEQHGIKSRYPQKALIRSRIYEKRGDTRLGQPVFCELQAYGYELQLEQSEGTVLLPSTEGGEHDVIKGDPIPGNPGQFYNGMYRRYVTADNQGEKPDLVMESHDQAVMILTTTGSGDTKILSSMSLSVESPMEFAKEVILSVAKFRANRVALEADRETVINWEQHNLAPPMGSNRNPHESVTLNGGVVVMDKNAVLPFIVADVKIKSVVLTSMAKANERLNVSIFMDYTPPDGTQRTLAESHYQSPSAIRGINIPDIPLTGCSVSKQPVETNGVISVRVTASHPLVLDYADLDLQTVAMRKARVEPLPLPAPASKPEKIASRPEPSEVDNDDVKGLLQFLADLITAMPVSPKNEAVKGHGLSAFRWMVDVLIPDSEGPDILAIVHEVCETVMRERLGELNDRGYRRKLEVYAQWFYTDYELIRSIDPENKRRLTTNLSQNINQLIAAALYYSSEGTPGDKDDAHRKGCIFLYMYTQAMRLVSDRELYMVSMPDAFEEYDGFNLDRLAHQDTYRRYMLDTIIETVNHWTIMKSLYGDEEWFKDQEELEALAAAFISAHSNMAEAVLPQAMCQYGRDDVTMTPDAITAGEPFQWKGHMDLVSGPILDFFHIESHGITPRYPGLYVLKASMTETLDTNLVEQYKAYIQSGDTTWDNREITENDDKGTRTCFITQEAPVELDGSQTVELMLSPVDNPKARLESIYFSLESEAGFEERIVSGIAKFQSQHVRLQPETELTVSSWEKNNLSVPSGSRRTPYVHVCVVGGLAVVNRMQIFDFVAADCKVSAIHSGDMDSPLRLKLTIEHDLYGYDYWEVLTSKELVTKEPMREINPSLLPVVGCARKLWNPLENGKIRVKLESSHEIDLAFVNLDLMPTVEYNP